MRGRVSDWVLFPQRVSPLRRRVSFWMPRKKPKRHQGAAQDERFALIFAHPTPSVATRHLPLTGGVGPGPHFYGGRQLGKLGGYRKGAGGQGIGFCSITAAAEFPATFGRCSYWLEARLCVGRAQVRLSGWHILGRLLISVGAATWGRPYGEFCTGSDGSAKSGAGAESRRRQFLPTQAPVGREEFRHSLRFCAPEILLNFSRARLT